MSHSAIILDRLGQKAPNNKSNRARYGGRTFLVPASRLSLQCLATLLLVIASAKAQVPPANVPKGLSCMAVSKNPIPASSLANPSVDMVSIGGSWDQLEATEGVYSFGGIVSEVQRAAAANKKVLIRVSTMGGSATFGGNTPDWVFDAIGAAPGGDLRSVTDGATTSGSPTVTSATANFATGIDVGQPISGIGIPAGAYVGIVNSPSSIGLSSSSTSNTPVNATVTGTNVTLIMANRPYVAHNRHDVVWGHTYSYIDPNPNHDGDPNTTIPVFWEPTFLAKKKRFINELGNYLVNGTTLTSAEKAAIAVITVSFANAQSEDWNLPHAGSIRTGEYATELTMWLGSPTQSNVLMRGAGYTTPLMQAAAINEADFTFTDGTTISGTTRIQSNMTNFTMADVGKAISGGSIPTGATIASWTNHGEVQISAPCPSGGSNITITITARDTGIFDVAAAAFPNAVLTNAIGNNGSSLDSNWSGTDSDVGNHLARIVNLAARNKYPGRIVAQVNQISNKDSVRASAREPADAV